MANASVSKSRYSLLSFNTLSTVRSILKELIEAKVASLPRKGYVDVSSKEIYRLCIERLKHGDEKYEDKCRGIVAAAAAFLNHFGERLRKSRSTKWRLTAEAIGILFNISYQELRDKPINKLSDIEFLYIVENLLNARLGD
jgi:hypothetical protein